MEVTSHSIPVVDICVVVVLLLGMIGGIRRGFSGEIIRIVTIIAAILVGWKGADAGAVWLADRIDWAVEDLKPYAFFGLIVATYIFLAIIRLFFRLLINFSFRGKLEPLGGAAIGLMRAAIFAAVILLGASLLEYPTITSAIESSYSGSVIIRYVRPLYNDIATRHPDLKLPPLEENEKSGEPAEPATGEGLDTPAYEEYLGPLIDESGE